MKPVSPLIRQLALAVYPSEKLFHALRPGAGLEVDFGVMWRVGGTHPRYRVSYVPDNGDVYAYGNDMVLLLGTNPAPEPEAPYPEGYAAVEEVLRGWADGVHGDELAWVVLCLQRAGWRDAPPTPLMRPLPRSLRAELFARE